MPILNKTIAFLGLGSASASTRLYGYLREHPGVFIPLENTHYFSDTKQYARGLAWYESHFPKANPLQLAGELEQEYLASAQAAGLIARTYPSARLLAVIDNPLVSVKVEYIEALRRGELRRGTTFASYIQENPEVLLRARYGRQLAHYYSYYSNTDLLVLLADEVRNTPLPVLRQTFEHLGLDEKFVPSSLLHLIIEEEDETKKRPGIIKRSMKGLKKLVKRAYTTLAHKINPPKIVKETAREQALRVSLAPELEAKLKVYFTKDVAELSALLHRDLLAEWGFK